MTKLRILRLGRNLKQTEVAKLVGIHPSTYCLLESGRLSPSRNHIKKLEGFFGETAEKLFQEFSIEKRR